MNCRMNSLAGYCRRRAPRLLWSPRALTTAGTPTPGESRPAFLRWFDEKLKTHPYLTKATSTGVTYIFSDGTAQLIEYQTHGESRGLTPSERCRRTLVFSATGFFWIGPLLTAWFNTMYAHARALTRPLPFTHGSTTGSALSRVLVSERCC